MGVETAAADAAPTIPTTPTLPTTSCVCGKRAAVKTCDACALRYCHECCVRRHRHGAFARHIIVELAEPTIDGKHPMAATTNEGVGKTPTLAVANSNKSTASTPCDECQDRGAVVACGACELRFCSPCLTSVHAVGSMQSHEGTGSFVEVEPLEQEPTTGDDEDDPSQRHVAHAVDSLLQDDPLPAPRKPSLLSDAPFCHGTTDAADPDPDQELSPTPPAKASSSSALSPSDSTTTTASSSASSSSYDLWGSWSVRSFSGERSSLTSPPPLSGGASDWRAFRASSSSSPPPSLSLSLHEDNSASDEVSTIARSLRSLSFAANAEELEPAARPVAVTKRAPRPRSFSDYTSLGSVRLHDIWSERGPALQAETRITPPSIPTPAFSTVGDELSRSMKTTVASRHVIVRSHAGAFNASSLRRVLDTLSAYGPLASIREEFTGDGVLFCTFFQLKAAIGAVKLWFTNNNRSRVGASESSAFFSVPYELPNDINCATLLVHLHGPAVASAVSEMRQLCSRYGEVASVLERDANEMGAVPFLVEYNDARDVAAALSSLAGMLLPSGHVIAASRSHPPTFDMTKVQAFQESVEAIAVATQPPFLTRPKSFSESTSHLTSPSSTSSSSPLHGSFFETRTSSFRQVAELEATDLENFSGSTPGSRSTSPFTPSLAAAGSAWRVREAARPRSSSAFASLSTDGSSSSLLGDPFAPSPARPSRYAPHQHSASYRTLPTTASSGSLNPHALMLQGRMGPIRIGSDPGFRGSYAASTASSTTSSVGRNDQGTGEYSLSIEKVAAGDDTRTTLMVRNIPNKYTQQMLLAEINMHHHGQYDFFYLPIDFKNKCNMGYAFINFIEAASIVSFYQEFDSQKWTNFNSEKVCAISYARLQGKQAMITRFQNSSLLEKHESYRPLVFYSSGPLQGTPEPFPSPKPQSQPQPHLQHHPHGGHTFKKLPHQHHQYPSQYQHHQQSQMLLTTSDEYLLAAHTGRLYAHHQHHQPHQQLHHAAHVLHGHALLANAHAAAAAMLHTMPGLGMQQPAQCSAPPPRASVHYGHAYQLQPDHRHGQPFMNGSGVLPSSRPAHHSHSAFGSFSGANYSSSSSSSS